MPSCTVSMLSVPMAPSLSVPSISSTCPFNVSLARGRPSLLTASCLYTQKTKAASGNKPRVFAVPRRSFNVCVTSAAAAGRAISSETSKSLKPTEPACASRGSGGSNGRGPHPPGGSGGSGPGGSGDVPGDGGRGRMKPLTIAFALFVLVGGVMGYKKKHSKDSLIASSIIAGLLLFSSYLMGKPNTTYGIRLALVTTASLAAYMGKGYYDKRKVFPQGVLTILSSLLTIGYLGAL